VFVKLIVFALTVEAEFAVTVNAFAAIFGAVTTPEPNALLETLLGIYFIFLTSN